MKVTFKTGSEVNYGSTNGEMFFASDTKQLLLNGVKYIPKKLSELTNDSGFLTSITKSMVENVLTGNITSHKHSYLPLSGGTLTGTLTVPNIKISGLVSVLPSHYFHYLYSSGTNVYEHFGQIDDIDKVTYGNFRFFNGEGSYKTLRIGGDGTFIWDGVDVSLSGHTHTFASIKDKPTTLRGYGITDIKHVWGYDCSNGCLVKTKVSNISRFVRLHIYGTTNSASLNKAFKPVCTIVDCYNYSTGVIELNATHFGEDFGNISAFIYNGYLCFWFKQQKIYTAFNVYGYITNSESDIYNIVREITNESIPSENVSKLITVTPTKIAYAFGTSSQFLKGDGSLDSNTYALSSALNNYLPLSGGTLNGNLTVPTLTSTGGIVLGDSSLSAMVSSIGIQRYDETGFIGFLKDFNLGGSFNGVVLGWDGNYSLSTNSVRIDASTFTYKGNSVLHSGNLGYTSSGLSRAVQKDANGNLFIVAPSLFEQGISNHYPKNLRWITEDEGQLAYDTEETAGTTSTVQVSIPVANGTSKGFMKSISTVTDVTGYTPCPVKSGTPYYKLDAIALDYTDFLELGSGSIESNLPLSTSIPNGGSLEYILNYTVDNIPRLLTIAIGSYCKYFFWLQQTDDDTPIVAYYHCQFNDLWLVIDSPNMEVRISQGSF